MPKFLNICLLFLWSSQWIFSQTAIPSPFESPLTIPLFLSGNFGELRANHFHAGIDMKTEGVTGKPVLVANEGYISRIKIQSGGYGNSLYITHPDGYTTVYGHLDRFIPEIQEFVRKNQYSKKSFEIELFPGSSQFVFEKGELIAYSGNTGRSGGPHLHFEIRKTNGQVPQNGLLYNFPIADNQAPLFKSMFLYSFNESTLIGNNGERRSEYKLEKTGKNSFSISELIISAGPYVGFGTEVYDFLNGSGNKCGVYSLELFFNNKLEFGFRIDEISFSNTRYINAHMDYDIKYQEGRNVHRLYSLPNNKLPIYYGNTSGGILLPQLDTIHQVRIEAYDAYNNKSTLEFQLKLVADSSGRVIMKKAGLEDWRQGGITDIENYKITIPSGALYRSLYLDLSVYRDSIDIFKDTLFFHHKSEPLQKSVVIDMKVEKVDEALRDKIVLVRINGDKNITSEGGEVNGHSLVVKTRNFGSYVLMADTLGPEIRPAGFISGRKYIANQRMQFEVVDKLSGIASYSAYIDDEWALLEYDAKSAMMTYRLDPKKVQAGEVHALKLHIVDAKNNMSEYYGKFVY